MTNVIADARFLTPERLLELREQGEVGVSLASLLDGMDLPEVKQGEKILGHLTIEEARLYRALYDANVAAEDFTREAIGRQLSKAGEALRTSDRNKPLAEVFANPQEFLGEDEDENRTFHRLRQHHAMLHACFYYHVGERFNLHEWRLGVRSGGRIVRIELR